MFETLSERIAARTHVAAVEADRWMFRSPRRRRLDIGPEPCFLWRSSWSKIDQSGFSTRQVAFVIEQNGTTAFCGLFTEWRGPGICFIDEAMVAMDEVSAADYALAEVLAEGWDEDDVLFEYGNVVEFRLGLIASEHGRGLDWTRYANVIINAEFARRGAALFIHACPLEYCGMLDDLRKF